MLNIEWPDEYYNSYEEPSETMEVPSLHFTF